jgi:hypothetical protein
LLRKRKIQRQGVVEVEDEVALRFANEEEKDDPINLQ